MKVRSLLKRAIEWAGANQQHRAIAAVSLVFLTFALAGGIYLVAKPSSGGIAPTLAPSATPGPGVCDQPSLIDAAPEGGPGDWSRVHAQAPALAGCYSLTAADFDAGGVTTSTSFVLQSTEAQDTVQLKSRLRVEPAVDFSIEALPAGAASKQPAQTGYSYRITPAAQLGEGQVYTFTLLDNAMAQPLRSWAFQTQQPLRIVATLPADQSTAVPTNIGIELTFSEDGVTGVEERFQIDPPTEGRFETHKRVVVFVPKSLQPATLYTVTLEAGASVPGGQTITEDFRYQFETGNSDRTGDTPGTLPLFFSRRSWESSTQEAPAVALAVSNPPAPATMPFTVYKFADTGAFIAALDQFTSVPSWAMASRSRMTIDTAGMDEFSSFEGELHATQQGSYGDNYVIFPSTMPVGLYLVETRYNDQPLQTLLQVTDVGTYVSLSRTKTLVWVNDLATKTALPGASITSDQAAIIAASGADGVALFDTPEGLVQLQQSYYGYTTTSTSGNLIVTAPDGRIAVVPLAEVFTGYRYYGYREYGFMGDPSLYWRFIYTERHLYHQTDTVHFWGLARPRDTSAAPQQVQVELTGYNYGTFGTYSQYTIASATVTPDQIGTFMGSLSFDGVASGWYQLQISSGDQVLTSTYIEVRDYVNPAYRLDVTPAKQAILSGETINISIKATFFDGTPVPNLALLYNSLNTSTPITTDASGEAIVTFAGGPVDPAYGSYGSAAWISVVPARSEESEISGSSYIRVFPAEIGIDATSQYSNGEGVITGSAYGLDLSRINDNTAGYYDDYRGAPLPGRTVTAAVTQEGYSQTETGEAYDFIQKIVRKIYSYTPVHTPIGSFTGVTDASGNFRITFPAARDQSYTIVLSTSDDAGRTSSTSSYLYSGYSPYNDWPTLVPDSTGPFNVGDHVQVSMEAGGATFPSGGDNRYLFFQAQNGITSYAIKDTASYSFDFSESNIPSVSVIGVRFTGGTFVEATYPFMATYDDTQRRLSVTVTPGQSQYAPGDTAALDVLVTDKDGNPVQADVLLSGVDEAAFQADQFYFFNNISILDQLYTSVPSGVYHTYASHQYPQDQSGAERGGGDGTRYDFEDVALFQQVTTDAAGHASVSFDLPDNLTSWRISALAVTQDLYAGSTVAFVPVTLPVFVDVTMNSTYLTSDTANVWVRAFGDALSTGDPVQIEVTSPTLFDGTITASGTAFQGTEVDLPALTDGTHQLHFKVTAAGHTDEIVRTITVVPSRLLRDEAHFDEVAAGHTFEPAGSSGRTTTVVISDHNRGRYYPMLSSLAWTYGDRLDQMLARNMAQDMLKQYFGEEPSFSADFRPSAYQTQNGGLAIFPFADDDLVMTSRIAALAPGQFGRQQLLQYLRGVYLDPNESRERTIIAMYGLAALDEPVLLDVQAAAALSDLTVTERLYIGLAAAELGDEDTATSMYIGLLNQYGERRGAAVRLNVGSSSDDILEATSRAAGLGSMLGDDNAPLLFEYTTSNYTQETLIQLEQLAYLAKALPRMSSTAVTATYQLDGDSHDAQLERGQSLALRLSPAQLDALNLHVTQGTAGVSTSYLAPFDAGSVQTDPAVSITRTYPGESNGAVTLHSGDLVPITLTWNLTGDAVDGCYQVSDLLPSGLKPVTQLYQYGIARPGVWYPYMVEGQRVSFCVWKGDTNRAITYYARVVDTGDYTAEPAVMQSQKAPESIGLTDALQISIR